MASSRFATRAGWLAISSTLSRAGSLLLVVLAARYLDQRAAGQLIVALTAGIALTTVLDPQAYDLLLVRPELAGRSWRRFDRLQLAATSLAGLLAAGFVAVFVSSSWPLVVLQAGVVAETFWRFRRVRHQLAGDYRRVGMVDVALGLGRALAAAVLIVRADLALVVAVYLGATALVGLLVARNPLSPEAAGAGPDLRQGEAFRLALPYGLATTASALYSQAPALLVTAIAGVSVGAPLAVISRFVQPPELAAQAVSVTGLHQLSDPALGAAEQDAIYQRMRKTALVLSLLVVVALALAWPVLGEIMSSVALPWAALAFCAPSIVVKFQNYQAVAAVLARGQATRRLRSSLVAAGLCIVLVSATCRPWGLYGALGSILVAEVALHVGLVRSLADRVGASSATASPFVAEVPS